VPEKMCIFSIFSHCVVQTKIWLIRFHLEHLDANLSNISQIPEGSIEQRSSFDQVGDLSAGWLPVHRDQLLAQCSVTSMDSLNPWKVKEHTVYTTVSVLWDADFKCIWVTL